MPKNKFHIKNPPAHWIWENQFQEIDFFIFSIDFPRFSRSLIDVSFLTFFPIEFNFDGFIESIASLIPIADLVNDSHINWITSCPAF